MHTHTCYFVQQVSATYAHVHVMQMCMLFTMYANVHVIYKICTHIHVILCSRYLQRMHMCMLCKCACYLKDMHTYMLPTMYAYVHGTYKIYTHVHGIYKVCIRTWYIQGTHTHTCYLKVTPTYMLHTRYAHVHGTYKLCTQMHVIYKVCIRTWYIQGMQTHIHVIDKVCIPICYWQDMHSTCQSTYKGACRACIRTY